jgi:hypothetical protein
MENRPHMPFARRSRIRFFKIIFGRRTRARLQPALKVLYPNGMLDFGMLYFNHDRRLTMTNVIDPIIIPEIRRA